MALLFQQLLMALICIISPGLVQQNQLCVGFIKFTLNLSQGMAEKWHLRPLDLDLGLRLLALGIGTEPNVAAQVQPCTYPS